MEVLRVCCALILFLISSYLIYDLIANGFTWIVLLAYVLGFILAHYIWPRGKVEDNVLYDTLEYVIDMPFRSIALLLRSIGKPFRSSEGGEDIDLID